jgi:hypothetical protein
MIWYQANIDMICNRSGVIFRIICYKYRVKYLKLCNKSGVKLPTNEGTNCIIRAFVANLLLLFVAVYYSNAFINL